MRLLLRISLFLLFLLLLVWGGSELFLHILRVEPPQVEHVPDDVQVAQQHGWRTIDHNYYRHSGNGLWEAYVQGAPFDRGYLLGRLAEDQVVSQEESFIAQIRRLVPSEWMLRTLKYGIVWFNRNLDAHVSAEYQQEIFGISRSFSDEYDFIADKYNRVLNYHAAHDIGHALQDLSIVGCTSFAVWDGLSSDSSLIIGRNFDFYMGDAFAKDKVVLFMRPDSGHAFVSITWAGFMGVVSGMNEHGLTVTLNAAKSSVPTAAKTPISLLAREILQYARNIDEAYAIARSRETFVSESILVGSAEDGAAVIIEKSPDRIDVFHPEGSRLTCANHYQSDTFRNDPVNLENIEKSDSDHRFKRMNELLEANFPISPENTTAILRDKKGVGGTELGLGNPKAINQLLAHHAIVFQPEKRLFWISTAPYQLGEFVCYDLQSVFDSDTLAFTNEPLHVDSLTLFSDPMLSSDEYERFERFKELKNRLFDHIVLGKPLKWNETLEAEFIATNPESYITYLMLGDLYAERDDCARAIHFYEMSLEQEVASEQERKNILNNIRPCR